MDFDWNNVPFPLESFSAEEVEESFEDPFAVRLMPDTPRFSVQARYFNLGMSANGGGIFSVYRTNGKTSRVLFARVFTAEEKFFYQKKLNQSLAS
jgi:uncharacterized DUF497 family protein